MRTCCRNCAPRPLWVRAGIYRAAVFVFVALIASRCGAAIDYEPFDYDTTELHEQNGGVVWSGAWTTVGTTSNTLSNDDVSLTYPTPFESGLTPGTSGSRVSTGGFGAHAVNYRLLSETVPLNVDGTVRFASALLRKNSANGSVSDNVLIEFFDNANNRRWGFGIHGVEDKPWLNANGSSTGTGASIVAGETYFLVTKIVASETGSDLAYLKVFGTNYGAQVPLAEPEDWDIILSQPTNAVLDRIRIRIDSANPAEAPGEVDEVRVGATWADVIGDPGPSVGVAGDYDGSGSVEASDYVIWRQNFGGQGGSVAVGDSEPDNDVDMIDYDHWRARYGNISGSGSEFAVPEPNTLLLAAIVAALLIVPRFRSARLTT